MDNLFDKLQGSPEGDDSGMNTYELPHMPENQRRVMRVIMRKREIAYKELIDALHALPDAERMTRKEVDEALGQLSQEGHILIVLDGKETTYKPNLRRKSGRNLMIKGIWDVLDSANEKVDTDNQQRRKTSNMANLLYGKLEETKSEEKKPEGPPAEEPTSPPPPKPETF